MATVRNLGVSVIDLYSRYPGLTGGASGSFQLGFPYSGRAVRIHIVPRTGAPAAQHPFLGHPWCVRNSDQRIPWGVLTARCIADVLCLVRAQDVEEEIKCPRYLIGAMGAGAPRLRQDSEAHHPLCQLIFLNSDDNICGGSSQTMATIPWTSWFFSHVQKMETTLMRPRDSQWAAPLF